MRHQADGWLIGDWVVFGAHLPHWTIVIAGLVIVALLIAWFERHKSPSFSRCAATDHGNSAVPEGSASQQI
jgi:hypothetical protein